MVNAMKKFSTLFMLALMSSGMFAVPTYLVQTGYDSDAKWSSSVVTATGAQLVDLRVSGQELDEWINTTTGCEIWLAAGMYYVNAGMTAVLNYQLYGGFAGTESALDDRISDGWQFANPTIIDGDSHRIVLDGKNVQGTTWNGLTFRNSQGNNGGVARLHTNSRIENCLFVSNTASNQGGVLQTYNGNNIVVSGCCFENNKGVQGGAIYVNNAANNTYTVNGCSFKNNEATGTANAGGAIHCQGKGIMQINACVFDGNKAAGNGDAVSSDIKADAAAKTSITNCLLFDQSGQKHAVYLAEGVIYNCTFANNAGGAVYTAGTDLKTIANNIIWGVNAEECRLALADNANTSLKNNAIGKMITYENMVQENNVEIDTLHTTYFKDVALKDFHLTASATAMIGAGLDLSTDGVTTDLAGDSRTAGSYDIGCYIYVEEEPTGCENVTTERMDGIRYNLQGQRVGEDYHGIVIMDGKKYLQQ